MEWVYGKYGDEVYTDLKSHAEAIENHIEREEITLSPKSRKELLSEKIWQAQREIMQTAQQLATKIGDAEHLDFNQFEILVDKAIKLLNLKLSGSERKQILNAISWRDERAAKVVKKVHKLSGAKLKEVLAKLATTAEKLSDYGYWPAQATGTVKGTAKPDEFIEYETDSDLRDTENVPLSSNTKLSASSVIHDYFIREVRPHVNEAWIALDKTVIGYEISFNKYFYQHKPLRSLSEVTKEILALEAETDGLLKALVSFVGGAS
jgi:type I restriction enzyme M protein